MAGELDPNADLFGGNEEADPQEEHMKATFGRNPNRTSAMADIFMKEMLETVNEDESIPPEAKTQMIFKMAANSALDIVLESLDPETREEVCACVDGFLGMCLTNKKFGVDIFGELSKAMSEVKREEGESDEDFDKRLSELEDAWWSIPQPLLNGRNPSDAISEEAKRYGLE